MGKELRDLTGERFGRLTVMYRAENRNNLVAWRCRCDCGNETDVLSKNLVSGNTRSCGCYHSEIVSELKFKHGMSLSSIYKVWQNIHQRCENPNDTRFQSYGGKMVIVCDEWRTFEPFYEWAKENGYAQGLMLTRIDPNGDYEPSNCKFTTMKEICKTRRRKEKCLL